MNKSVEEKFNHANYWLFRVVDDEESFVFYQSLLMIIGDYCHEGVTMNYLEKLDKFEFGICSKILEFKDSDELPNKIVELFEFILDKSKKNSFGC